MDRAGGDVLLELRGLAKSYDGRARALDGVNLEVRRGEFVSIIGSSGAGKSTLLRCVNRLIDPTEGSVIFDGDDVTRVHGRALRACRRRIAMVFQHYNLVHRATAIENVLQGRLGYKSTIAGMFGLFSEDEKRRAFEILGQVGLSDFAYVRTDQLSGGQKQRVGIARALVQDPLLMLADEPIASLDPKSSRTVMEHLRWAADELGVACLVNLHQVDFALEFSDRIVGLAGGKLVFDGAPDELNEAMIARIYGTDMEGVGVDGAGAGAGAAGVADAADSDAANGCIGPAAKADRVAGRTGGAGVPATGPVAAADDDALSVAASASDGSAAAAGLAPAADGPTPAAAAAAPASAPDGPTASGVVAA